MASNDQGSRRRTTSFADQQAQAAAGGEVDPSALTGVVVSTGSQGEKITTVVAHPGHGSGGPCQISYRDTKVVGNGSFGVVFTVNILPSGEQVAIKKVLQDKRFKNREKEIMTQLRHTNIVELLYFFFSNGTKKDEVYLNLVLEFIPETLYTLSRSFSKQKAYMPPFHVALYSYQMYRGLAYIHALGVCHRDIKPQNVLVDASCGVLKLCDFGSAKRLVVGEANVSYICSRYYRAPELIFGATNYTYSIDVWSAGCVVAELMLGQPIFPGESGVDQLVEIIKVMGTPTKAQISAMNQSYTDFKFPQIKANEWSKVFRPETPAEAVGFIGATLVYEPTLRVGAFEALAHPFFDQLRAPGASFDGRPLPPLFNFTPEELAANPAVAARLQPAAA